jgi:tetratricopeptide (TPR) repeat protein
LDKETKNHSAPHAPTHSHHKTEAFGISDKELNSKDEMTKQLTISFDWIVAHKFFVIFVLAIFFVSGLGYVVYSKTKLDTELKVQEKYFVVEKKYLDQRTQFDEAEREQKAEQDKAKAPKAKATPEADKKTPKALASGDLEKDYGTVVKEFNDLLTAQPKSLAGKMTSLLLADIYGDYNKHEEALASLSKSAVNNPKDLIDLLVSKKKVNAMLSLNQFAEAEKELLKLLNQKSYPFLNSQFKLLLGLSYEGLKQWDKAESQFQEIIAKGSEAETLSPEEMAKRNRFSSDVSAYEQAQKYLILLKLKKDSEKAGS